MKDKVKIYDKLVQKIIKKFTISTILLKPTILKNEGYYFYAKTILHYFTLPTK